VAVAPEIPTVAETALPGFEAATWFALVAPADTPRDIVLRLNTEVRRLLTQPDSQRRFADLGMTSEGSTPEALDTTIKSEIAKWSKVIKDADIRPQD
jgi:tripartite-type tricarboxylate transporter receptor subunit TctC